MKFNIRLKECRNEKGWTQEGISKISGIKRPRYAKYETGENQPDYNTVIKFANLFGVNTDYLLGKDNNKHMIISQNTNGLKYLITLNIHLKKLNIDSKE